MYVPVKIVMVGDCQVGKTTLLSAYNTFMLHELPSYSPTCGVNYKMIKSRLSHTKFDLHFWDISGDPIHKHVITNYLHKLDILIVVFSLHNRKSFHNVVRWYNLIKSKAVNEFQVYVVATSHPNELPDVHEKELLSLSTYLNVKIKTVHHHSLQSFRYFLIKQIIKVHSEKEKLEMASLPSLPLLDHCRVDCQFQKPKMKWWRKWFLCCS